MFTTTHPLEWAPRMGAFSGWLTGFNPPTKSTRSCYKSHNKYSPNQWKPQIIITQKLPHAKRYPHAVCNRGAWDEAYAVANAVHCMCLRPFVCVSAVVCLWLITYSIPFHCRQIVACSRAMNLVRQGNKFRWLFVRFSTRLLPLHVYMYLHPSMDVSPSVSSS